MYYKMKFLSIGNFTNIHMYEKNIVKYRQYLIFFSFTRIKTRNLVRFKEKFTENNQEYIKSRYCYREIFFRNDFTLKNDSDSIFKFPGFTLIIALTRLNK